MLFLLNDQIVEVAVPEMHLERRWKTIGCGRPHAYRPEDVVNFVHARLDQARIFVRDLSYAEACDLASLVISRTGANSLFLKCCPDGSTEPVLRLLPPHVMEVYASGAANDECAAPRSNELARVAFH